MDGLVNEIKETIENAMGDGYKVIVNVYARNNTRGKGIFICKKGDGDKCGPQLDLDKIVKTIKAGNETVESAAGKIIDVYKASEEKSEAFLSMVNNMTKEDILGKAICNVVNKERNKERLVMKPHKDMLDLAVIYRVMLTEDEDSSYSFIVTHNMCESYGISIQELDEAAMRNTENKGFETATIGEIMSEKYGMPASVFDSDEFPMYVITTKEECNGAAAMMFNRYLDEIADKLGDDLYIFPSSIHEIIAIPVKGCGTEGLVDMVKSINAAAVDENDYLSDSIYKYKRQEKELVIASQD